MPKSVKGTPKINNATETTSAMKVLTISLLYTMCSSIIAADL
jgi:hypothetical protein